MQLAAVVIEPRNLEVIPNSELNLFLKPDKAKSNPETIDFHAKRLKLTREEVIDLWDTYPDPKVVWPEFQKYLRQYHIKQDRQSMYTAPIAAGMNIIRFDIPLVDRYHSEYGDKKVLFAPRDKVDLMYWFFAWFENNADIPNFKLDDMRDYFGMSKENAHDALQDVKDCAEIIIKFLKLHRTVAAKVKFKGAFKNEKADV